MHRVEYQDFLVQIMPGSEGAFTVKASSPVGSRSGVLNLPFAPEEVFGLTKSAAETRKNGAGVPTIGEMLFDALMTGEVGTLYHQTVGAVEGAQGQGLRVTLQFDLDDARLRSVTGLPWEMMRHRSRRQDLNLSTSCQVVRFLEVLRPRERPQVELPVRVLVAYANPIGTAGIDEELVAAERAMLAELGASGEFEVEFLEHASLSSIREALQAKAWHVFHYLGHGSFRKGSAEGFVNLEAADGSGRLDAVKASALAVVLDGCPTLSLVQLNACKSAQLTTRDDRDAFRGTAAALVMAGIPAVIAMQYIVSATAAVDFSRGLYEVLKEAGTLENAVAAGRRRMFENDRDGMEWATPVLFTRLPANRTLVTAPRDASPSDEKSDDGTDTSVNVVGEKNIVVTDGGFEAGDINF